MISESIIREDNQDSDIKRRSGRSTDKRQWRSGSLLQSERALKDRQDRGWERGEGRSESLRTEWGRGVSLISFPN